MAAVFFSCSPPHFLRWDLSLNLEFTSLTRLAGQQALRIILSVSSKLGPQVCETLSLLLHGWRIGTHVIMLATLLPSHSSSFNTDFILCSVAWSQYHTCSVLSPKNRIWLCVSASETCLALQENPEKLNKHAHWYFHWRAISKEIRTYFHFPSVSKAGCCT